MLHGMRILASGTRDAVELGATALAQAGAQIVFADTVSMSDTAYDAVIVSSDTCGERQKRAIARLKASGATIVCDITAVGASDCVPCTDTQIQAMSGLMDTTGFAHGEPVRIGVPFVELSAALYASAAIAAALRARRVRGARQNIDVSLLRCAACALTTFLPAAFAGDTVERVGNRHPACAPWNAYRTGDGWVLICTSTEEQWCKIKRAAGMPELDDASFSSLNERVRHVDALDALLERWTTTMTTAACCATCERIGVAAGPIVSVEGLAREPNFAMRHAHAAAHMTMNGIERQTYREISLFGESPLSDEARANVCARDGFEPGQGPLAGVKVIEIGQYTTAPLVGKHLAALGAEVIKVEAPGGEVSRTWMPGQHGTSYFFALNNTDKRTIALDLKREDDRAHLQTLLADADVLVENLRPGALAKLGFDRHALAVVNPRLVYCSISGFGVCTAYPGRPAFDTVIQAMSGLMDLTRSEGEPVKIGASAADILGGQAALLAIVARLAAASTEKGSFLEVAMQDVAAWAAVFAAGRTGAERVDEVRSVKALTEDGDLAEALFDTAMDTEGNAWRVVNLPYRFSRTIARIRYVPGAPERMSMAGAFGE